MTPFDLLTEKPQQRPVTNLFLRFYTVLSHQEGQTTSAQLGLVPPSFRLLAIGKAFCAIKIYFSSPFTTTSTLKSLPVFKRSQSMHWDRHSPLWIAKICLRLPCHGHKLLLPWSSQMVSQHGKFETIFDK